MTGLPLTALSCLALVLGGSLVAGCGSSSKSASTQTQSTPTQSTPKSKTATPPATSGGTSAAAAVAVEMKNVKFVPAAIKVKVGQKITWTNKDGFAHNVTSNSGEKISSGNVGGGASYSFTPKKAGKIAYECTIHPGQTGTISVTK